MPAIALDRLDEYSKIVAPIVFDRFPSWRQFAKISPRHDGAGNVVEFNVPCPSQTAEAGLWLSTADEELSVGFHTHHQHFTNYEDRTDRICIDGGLDYAAAIVEDRVGVLSYYCADDLVGSRFVNLPSSEPLPNLYEGLGSVILPVGSVGAANRVVLVSWSGRFDREEALG